MSKFKWPEIYDALAASNKKVKGKKIKAAIEEAVQVVGQLCGVDFGGCKPRVMLLRLTHDLMEISSPFAFYPVNRIGRVEVNGKVASYAPRSLDLRGHYSLAISTAGQPGYAMVWYEAGEELPTTLYYAVGTLAARIVAGEQPLKLSPQDFPKEAWQSIKEFREAIWGMSSGR